MNRGVSLLVLLVLASIPCGGLVRVRHAVAFLFAIACGVVAEHGTGGDSRCGSFAFVMGCAAWLLLAALEAITAQPDGATVPAAAPAPPPAVSPQVLATSPFRTPAPTPQGAAYHPTGTCGCVTCTTQRERLAHPRGRFPWGVVTALAAPCGVVVAGVARRAGSPLADSTLCAVGMAAVIAVLIVAASHAWETRAVTPSRD